MSTIIQRLGEKFAEIAASMTIFTLSSHEHYVGKDLDPKAF